MPDESVKVAVRVRPFNQREIDRQAKLIVEMRDNMTIIRRPDVPDDEPKKFSFDYSYWSHDGYIKTKSGVFEAESSKYASQRSIFDDLGQGVLKNAFEGYNCSLFAYGQTGSGKSYSLIGYGPNKGIVPITCDELFKKITENKDANKRFEVTFSMLEIYNEQVRDLLSKDNPKGGLTVRQTPSSGSFYVQGLKQVPVGSYQEIAKRMEQGTASRTVASTNMNATSSRAHTVVTITFDQFIKTTSSESKKSSILNLVDLAGSERADSSGATGDRLKEGANINKSLSALGNVISALADVSTGKKKAVIPYRDSVLTKLLQNALGGNSKTVMIASLSPADINYDETLSTLRYADRAKRIKNKAFINENPVDKLIRELQQENEKLKKAIESGNIQLSQAQTIVDSKITTTGDMEKIQKENLEEVKAQLLANQERLAATEGKGPSWEEKLNVARAESLLQNNYEERNRSPHLKNINEDPMLSGVVYYFLQTGNTTFGRKDAKPVPDVCFSGISIMKIHAIISNKEGAIELKAASPGARIRVNGLPLVGPRILRHKDRILFGSNHLYLFLNPMKPDAVSDLPNDITWEFAQKEIASVQGFTASDASSLPKDKQVTQEQILELLPWVSEANAISEELNKYRSFDVVVLSPSNCKEAKVVVQMTNLLNENVWLWERGKFLNRRYLMQDLYQAMLEGDIDIQQIPLEEDPFWEPVEDALIGTASIFLQSLSYVLDFEDHLTITNFKGQEEGSLTVSISPCASNGRVLGEEFYVENPQDLIGQSYNFKVVIRNAEIKNPRYCKGAYVVYSTKGDDNQKTKTSTVKESLNPQFNHSRVISVSSVRQEHLDFFETGCITFFIYALQVDEVENAKLMKMTTKELRQMEFQQQKPTLERRNSIFASELPDINQMRSDFVLQQRKYERLEQKEKRIQELCREWKAKAEEDKQFHPFFNAVSAAAFSTGIKLKTRVQPLGTVKEDDTVSMYVFGEDEDKLQNEASRNGGYLNYEHLANHFGGQHVPALIESRKKLMQRRQSFIGTRTEPTPTSGGTSYNQHTMTSNNQQQRSRACILQ